jgi:hypothetical protein
MKLRNHADFAGYEARNKKEHVLGADPSLGSTDGGRTWWNSATGRFRGWDGSAAHTLTNLIEQITASGALHAALTGKTVDLTIDAASQTVPGTMSAADKTKLDGATNANTPSALVQRDASGNFSAGTISAALNGTASNASALGGQTLAQVRDFAQTTGTRDHTAINDFDTQVRVSRLDQLAVPTTTVSLNSQRIASLADPLNPQDAATKNYVDSVATGLDPHQAVYAATVAALPSATYANGTSGVGATLTATANGALTIDGVSPATNARVLIKDQAQQAQNGVYVVTNTGGAGAAFVLTRATDADTSAEVRPGLFVFVTNGATLANSGWVLQVAANPTIGTTALPFAQFSGSTAYTAGNGLTLTGSQFAAVGTANRITSGPSGIDIASNYVGQASITTLGTIGTGVWQGTPVALAYGGTGATTAAGARTALGATTKYAADLPAGTTITVTHNLGTTDVIILVFEKSSGDVVIVDPNIVDANNITIGFGAAVANAAYRVVVVG